jgi:formylglycine-generating enzyme required for sulfatase activity
VQRMGAPDAGIGVSLGADERYGVHAALHFGDLQQRLRWVPAGKFAMGSPKGPPEEGELRTVSLSKGFWIADTACSLGLWSRVMGLPTSGGDARQPVTGITAADAEAFLAQLAQRLPVCDFRLPSEAEWEAACRAGTRTAYAFGDEVGPPQVNAASRAPLPVTDLPQNAWGLFQMHGNVAELCRDLLDPAQRSPDVAVDPEGPPGAETGWHALRGGSWRGSFEQARSAAVDRIARSERRDDVGLRFIARARRPADSPSA